MKNNIITYLIIILIFIVVNTGFSQDSTKTKKSFQVSLNVAVPHSYNVKRRNNLRYYDFDRVISYGGYDIYEKLGGNLIIEYIKQVRKKSFLKAGIDFNVSSQFITAENNKILIEKQFDVLDKVHIYNSHIYTSGICISLGYKYVVSKKHSLFFNIYKEIFYISYGKINYYSNKSYENLSLYYSHPSLLNNYFFKLGYNYEISCNLLLYCMIDADLSSRYSLGLKYQF